MAAALTVVVVGSALAIGTVHRSVLLVVALAALAAAWLSIRASSRDLRPSGSRRSMARTARLALPALGALALAVFTTLQALPLPVRWLGAIASPNADVWSRALLPLGETVTWGSISLDPGASLAEALKLCAYASVLLAAAHLASDRATRAWPIAIVFASALALALVTAAHELADATRVFGIYAPRNPVDAHHLGPLLNPNNLAGYLVLGVFCGIGLLLMREPPLPVWASGIGVAVLIGACVRTGSRGGVAVLPIGFVLVLVLLAWARFRHRIAAGGRALGVLGAALASGIAFAIAGGTFGIWRELLQDNLSKLRFIPATFPLVSDHAWLGIGRGTFESAFTAYRLVSHSNTVFTHPENFPVQWLAEWGIPFGGAALIGLAWVLRPGAIGATKSGLAAGAWTGVIVLLAQNLVDLGIELAGVSIALFCTIGALWGMRGTTPAPTARLPDARRVFFGTGALAVLTAAAMTYSGLRDVRQERDVLHAAYERLQGDDADGRQVLSARLRSAMLRHPADYWFPLLGATIAWRFDDPAALKWVQRALERAPLSGRTHLLLAEILAGRGAKAQALFELRLAAEYEAPLVKHTAALAARWATSFDDVMRAVPEGPLGASVLDAFAGRTTDPALARRADAEALILDPTRAGPRARIVDRTLYAIETKDEGVCPSLPTCEAEVAAHADFMQRLRPSSSDAAQVRARLHLLRDEASEADALLRTACALPDSRKSCLALRARVLGRLGRTEEIDAVLKAYLAESCSSAQSCADAHTWIAEFRAERRENSLAVASLRRAAIEDPTEERWLRVADAAERAGQHALAVEALERVAERRGGADPALKKRLDDARRANISRYVSP